MTGRGPAHGPVRPGWTCVCGPPWPCPRELYVLVWEFAGHGAQLRKYMTRMLDLALADLARTGLGLAELEPRMRGWIPDAVDVANRWPRPSPYAPPQPPSNL